MYNLNWIDDLSPEQKRENEVISICHILRNDPHNPFWIARLKSSIKFIPRNRSQEYQSWLSRINSPEMIARRGTVLTPHGWRKPR